MPKSYTRTLLQKKNYILSVVYYPFQFNQETIHDPPLPLYGNCLTNSESSFHFPTKSLTCFSLYFQLQANFVPDPQRHNNHLVPTMFNNGLFSIINKLLDDFIQNKIICFFTLSTVRMGEKREINIFSPSCQ